MFYSSGQKSLHSGFLSNSYDLENISIGIGLPLYTPCRYFYLYAYVCICNTDPIVPTVWLRLGW